MAIKAVVALEKDAVARRATSDPPLRPAPRGFHDSEVRGIPRRATEIRERQDQPASRSPKAPWERGHEQRSFERGVCCSGSASPRRLACARPGARELRASPTRCASRCCADLSGAASCSACRAASTSSVSAALAVSAFGAKRVLGVLMPERDSDPDSLRLGHLVADSLGIETVIEDIAPILEAAGCYRRRDDFIRKLVPGVRRGLGLQGRADPFGRLQHHAARGAVARRRAADGAHAARCLSRRRGGDQHEAAHPQAARIFPRRPAELRRARYAEPARIRPGLFREERRRRGRHQADRASLQDAGLCARRTSRPAGGDPLAAADDRHLVAGAEPGGVLFLRAVSGDGPLPLRT